MQNTKDQTPNTSSQNTKHQTPNTSLGRMGRIGLMGLMAVTLAGCAAMGAKPTPPTAFERVLFSPVTNYIPVVVPVTNYAAVVLPVTNYETVTLTLTNQQNVVELHTNRLEVVELRTNQVAISVGQQTNLEEAVTLQVKPGTTTAVQTAAGVVNMFAPGMGTMAGSALLAILGGWAYLRGNKKGNTATALSQEFESVLEFVKTLPNGQNLYTAITTFLQNHQLEAGVVTEVMNLLEKEVSNPDAQVAAKEIATFLGTLKPA